MKKAPFLIFLAGFLTLPFLSLLPQAWGQATHAPDGGYRLTIISIAIPTIPDAPFTATVKTELIRRLEDGSMLVRKNHRLVARDSSGRTFQERRMLTPDDDTRQAPLTSIQFRNPISHEAYNCDPQGQVCHEYSYQPLPSQDLSIFPDMQGQGPQVTRVNIGTSMISGVQTIGTREITIIPTTVAATNRPLTISKEFWYSKELGINIVTKRVDPRSGTQNFLVDDLILGEPNPSLFEVPAGATILREAVQPPGEN